MICYLKSVFLVACLIQVVELAVEDRLKDDFFHIYKNAAIETRDIQNNPVTEDKVTFYLYTSENPEEFTAIDKDNLERFRNTTNEIVFLIHGWTNSRDSPWLNDMKNAFLIRNKDCYVIIVDWQEPANQFYYVSSINTYDVSKFITNLLTNLYKNYGVDKKQFLLVGHSLGGQITGFVGKLFKKATLETLPRIIALDPAGPLFTSRPVDKRLNKNDADVVEVIHTDGGTFGFDDACGTIDFFVNGGSSQPGCKKIDLADPLGSFKDPLMCDHQRAYAYFIEALLNPTDLVAQKCSNWAQFKVNYCDKETVPLGDLNTTLTGRFYLETNKEKPYTRKTGGGFSLSRLLHV
ncbi:phospholipase A1-like [Anthonomus grandis grandis]|uniref:phospholipase A1-like n=1 Tax=Anthonomus grandis grandis TaxID=2921223 RepID=UPI0021653C55|nr:phospholipase A1-like [Anthonomus grandis grandis]